jgi:hypothetical protein
MGPSNATSLQKRRRIVALDGPIIALLIIILMNNINIIRISVTFGNPKGMRPFGRPRHSWDDNTGHFTNLERTLVQISSSPNYRCAAVIIRT